MPTPRVSVHTIPLKAGRVGTLLLLLHTCAVGIFFALIEPPTAFAQNYGVELSVAVSAYATDGVGGCTPPDAECFQKNISVPAQGGFLKAFTTSLPIAANVSAAGGNSASANANITASLGTLNGNIDVDASVGNIGAAGVVGSGQAHWTDTITITSTSLPVGTSVQGVVTLKIVSSITNPLDCNSFDSCPNVEYQVLPWNGTLFINTGYGPGTSVQNQSAQINNSYFYVGEQIIVQAGLDMGTISAGGSAFNGTGAINATGTFNFDVCTPGASYTTGSGMNYASGAGSNACGPTSQITAGLGACGNRTNPQACSAEPISTGNGNYYYQHTDLAMSGNRMPILFQRSYNSLDTYFGPLGANWTNNYNIVLTPNSSGAVIKWDDGHEETFTLSGGIYFPQPGVFNTLTGNSDGTFVLTRKDQTQFAFSSNGNLTGITDKNGNTVALTYGTSGNLDQVADAVGRSFTISYDSSNRISGITDPIGRNVAFQYDSNNNLVQVTDPAGGITTYAYDANHRVTSIRQPNSQLLLQNAYDSSGRVISQTNGQGFTWSFAFGTPNAGDTTITDARGNQVVHSYDSMLRIVKIKDAAGGFTSFVYDANNDRTSVTNQNGKTSSFSYDPNGNVTGIVDPLGDTSAFTYDSKNNLLTATNAKGQVTAFSYDAKSNLTAINNALGNKTSFVYDGSGELTSRTDARGDATTLSYDSSGNLTSVTDALGHSSTLAYDTIGRLTSITDPNGHTTIATYDALSRLIKTTDPAGGETQFAYDAIGNLLKITDANGIATTYAYDPTNNLIRVTDGLGHSRAAYLYDPNNNRVAFANANGNVTFYFYDALNRQIAINDPLSFTTSYGYDPVGNVVASTDAKGQKTQFAFDALNRLISISYADGQTVAYSYDADGNRTSMADSHGTTGYAYDALDRLTSIIHPGGKIVKYGHDAVGNRTSLTYPDGKVLSYSFDPANRLVGVTDWTGRNTSYSYDPSGNLIGIDYPNRSILGFNYKSNNQLLSVVTTYPGRHPVLSFLYFTDQVGNRLLTIRDSSSVTIYDYDALYELTSVNRDGKITSYTYDPVGNRLSLTEPGTSINYTYDADDRLLSSSTATFTYDADGNETSKTNISNGESIVYSYDAANRLIHAASGISKSNFTYDGDGNRVGQSIATGTYDYLNDVASALPVVLQESGPDGNIGYVHGLGLISELSSSFDYSYLYDGLGTVVGLTDARGKLVESYDYDTWGESLKSIPKNRIGTENKFRFTGEALDPETGLYYLRARYYDPQLGRFISRDPFSGFNTLPISRNRYIYGWNNPTRFIDRSGKAPESGPLNPAGFEYNVLGQDDTVREINGVPVTPLVPQGQVVSISELLIGVATEISNAPWFILGMDFHEIIELIRHIPEGPFVPPDEFLPQAPCGSRVFNPAYTNCT
jgi:RHS repeat-associated protein